MAMSSNIKNVVHIDVRRMNTYYDGYAKLASAIITSGIKQNDQAFLNSDWKDILSEMCRLDEVLHDTGTYSKCYTKAQGQLMKLQMFKDIAYAAARQSTCCRLHVGAVIYNMNTNQLYSIGYNGTMHGFVHCNKLFPEPGKVHKSVYDMLGYTLPTEEFVFVPYAVWRILHHEFSEKYELHAEQNAILNMLKTGVTITENLAILSTTAPCCTCAKFIAGLGIKHVFYCDDYDRHNQDVFDYYDELGLIVCKV